AVHPRLELLADAERSGLEGAEVRVRRAALLRIAHLEQRADRGQLAGVTHLPAGLGVEGRAVEHHLALLARLERLDGGAVPEQRDHPAARLEPLIALEQGA